MKLPKLTPNTVIIPVSTAVAVVLFCLARRMDGIWYDFTINMSASVLVIGITVLLVDILREYHKSRQYKVPRQVALNKIANSNAVLAMTLALFNRENHVQIIRKYVKGANSSYTGTLEAMKDLAKLPSEQIVATYSDEKLISDLKSILQRVSETYSEVNTRYSFSFRDIAMRADFTKMIEHLDAAVHSFSVIGTGMTNAEMNKIFTPVDPKKPGKPMTKNRFVGMMVQKYLQSYVNFVNKHVVDK